MSCIHLVGRRLKPEVLSRTPAAAARRAAMLLPIRRAGSNCPHISFGGGPVSIGPIANQHSVCRRGSGRGSWRYGGVWPGGRKRGGKRRRDGGRLFGDRAPVGRRILNDEELRCMCRRRRG